MTRALSTRLHLRGLWTLLAALALLASTSAGALAQDATPVATPQTSPAAFAGAPAVGDAVVVFDDRGDELAQVAVLGVADPFEDTTSNASRGSRYVSVEVAVQNLGDGAYEFDPYDIRLLDAEGILYSNSFVSRTEESRAETADLSSVDLEAGATTSGLLVFEMVDAATPALVAFTDRFESFTLLADLRETVATEGEATTLYDEQGEEIGSVTLDESLTALEDEADSFDVGRGETVFGANLTVENTGDAPLTPDLYSLYVVDEFGYLYSSTSFFRDEEEAADLPDFPSEDIEAGDSASGLVAFTLPTEVQVSYILYIPGGSQLFVVAQLGDGSVVSGDVLTPVPPVVEDDAGDAGDDLGTGDASPVASAECAELDDWSAATRTNLGVLDELDILQAETAAGVTAADLRDAAVEIHDASDAQGELDVPALAADTNDAIVDFLDTFAGFLEDGADQVEGGADPEDVFAEDALSEDSDLGVALTALVEVQVELQTTCPELDINL